ncbi:hypothetical protein L6452_05610 [Arctium lappa]|uniref:Uncharacterized protein n=1 Tax=Arctium lappa TaxID=4217 RepID=A0ACB9EGA8_ARCLA|nr:hypothetical protein L6452_05610 [Arctium lappa]
MGDTRALVKPDSQPKPASRRGEARVEVAETRVQVWPKPKYTMGRSPCLQRLNPDCQLCQTRLQAVVTPGSCRGLRPAYAEATPASRGFLQQAASGERGFRVSDVPNSEPLNQPQKRL